MSKRNDTRIKLNLGCGRDHRAGWVNIDALAELKPDLVHDLSQPLPFANGSVNEVLAQDILEHFTKEDLIGVVSEIGRVLKPGGTLTVRVPNIDAIFEQLANYPDARNQFIYGTTEETGIFGAHKVGFTPLFLTSLMLEHGLQLQSLTSVSTNWHAQFVKLVDAPIVDDLVYINQTLGMGGAESFMCDLLKQLQVSGTRLHVYVAHQPFAELLEQHGISTQRLPIILDIVGDWKGLLKATVLWPKAIWDYTSILKKHGSTDLVLFSGFTEKIVGSWIARLLNLPVTWIEFGPVEPLLSKFAQFPKLLYYSVKQIPEKIIVPSQNTLRHLTGRSHVDLAKLSLVPCGRKDVSATQKRKLKTAKQTPINVVCVSRLEAGKGQDVLIRTFAKVTKHVPSARLLIVGEGAFRAELERLIKEFRLENVVQLLGKVPDAMSELQTATVCVFPSVWLLEGFGLVMIEAMALGKPVVAFDHGPGNEIVVNEVTGLLARSGDVDDLATKIIEVLKNPALARSLARAGQQRFLSQYQIEPIATQYQQVFNQALAQHQARQLLKEIL